MQSSMSADNFLCTVLVNVAMQLFSLLLLRLLSAFLSAQAHPKSTFYTHTLQRNVQEHFYLYHRAYRKAPAAVQDISFCTQSDLQAEIVYPQIRLVRHFLRPISDQK